MFGLWWFVLPRINYPQFRAQDRCLVVGSELLLEESCNRQGKQESLNPRKNIAPTKILLSCKIEESRKGVTMLLIVILPPCNRVHYYMVVVSRCSWSWYYHHVVVDSVASCFKSLALWLFILREIHNIIVDVKCIICGVHYLMKHLYSSIFHKHGNRFERNPKLTSS